MTCFARAVLMQHAALHRGRRGRDGHGQKRPRGPQDRRHAGIHRDTQPCSCTRPRPATATWAWSPRTTWCWPSPTAAKAKSSTCHPARAQAPGRAACGHHRRAAVHARPPRRCWCSTAVWSKEACPLNLAPTASTTAQLALGDALAVALLDARGFRAEDFARSHPGGALGRKLLTHVSDVMRVRRGEVPQCGARRLRSATLMREMSSQGPGRLRRRGRCRPCARHLHRRRPAPPASRSAPTCAQATAPATSCTPTRAALRPDALAVDAAEMMEAAPHHQRAGGGRGRGAGRGWCTSAT